MWHRSILDTIKQAKEREMCLYGAGFWGKIAYRIFTKMGCRPVCFCDDDPEKCVQEYLELPVYSLEEAVNKYPEAVYLVCIDVEKGTGNREGLTNMLMKLKEYGVYDSNSELRVPLYMYLLDLKDVDNMDMIEAEELIHADDIRNVVIFNHMSNSGSFYLEQLLDGHPNILSLPYSTHVFGIVYEKRLKYLEGEELLIEMGAQMFGYFHSEYEQLNCIKNNKFCGVVGEKGEFIYDVLIYPDEFMRQLRMQFKGRKISLKSFGDMMKIYTAAYNNCLGRKRKKDISYWLFYHMHNANYDVADTYKYFYKNEFSRIENMIIIREPVQQCYSYIRRMIIKGKQNILLTKDEDFIHTLKCEMGLTLEKRKGIDSVKVIRFEDLKFHPEKTMKSFSRWLGIPYSESMAVTTTNGYKVYFPVYTENGVEYITGNDTTAVGQKDFSEALTVWDEARLNMIYSKFKKAYGYENDVPEFTEFDEAALEQILQKDFKFATIAQKVLDEYGRPEDKYDINDFIKKMYTEYMREYKEETEYYDYIRPVTDEG